MQNHAKYLLIKLGSEGLGRSFMAYRTYQQRGWGEERTQHCVTRPKGKKEPDPFSSPHPNLSGSRIKYHVPGTSAFLPKLGQQEFYSEIRGKKAKMAIILSGISLDFLGIGFIYKIADVLASPVTSKEFEVRISKDILLMKYLIKEVTLGKQETKNT